MFAARTRGPPTLVMQKCACACARFIVSQAELEILAHERRASLLPWRFLVLHNIPHGPSCGRIALTYLSRAIIEQNLLLLQLPCPLLLLE
jgi:hypothetical protein